MVCMVDSVRSSDILGVFFDENFDQLEARIWPSNNQKRPWHHLEKSSGSLDRANLQSSPLQSPVYPLCRIIDPSIANSGSRRRNEDVAVALGTDFFCSTADASLRSWYNHLPHLCSSSSRFSYSQPYSRLISLIFLGRVSPLGRTSAFNVDSCYCPNHENFQHPGWASWTLWQAVFLRSQTIKTL